MCEQHAACKSLFLRFLRASSPCSDFNSFGSPGEETLPCSPLPRALSVHCLACVLARRWGRGSLTGPLTPQRELVWGKEAQGMVLPGHLVSMRKQKVPQRLQGSLQGTASSPLCIYLGPYHAFMQSWLILQITTKKGSKV